MIRSGFLFFLAVAVSISCSKAPVSLSPEGEGPSIPIVYITTEGAAPVVSKDDYIEGTIIIEDKAGMYSDESCFEAPMKIKGRGNTTWNMPKKPWRIKLDEKACILGMSTDKDWCLLANYSDKTLIRNMTAMRLSEICGLSWSPRMVPVEVYFNGEYQGCYTFAEHKKVSSERVDIDVDAGACYLELDQSLDEYACFFTDHGIPLMFSDPEKPSYELFNSTIEYFNSFERALYAEDFLIREDHYSKYFDVGSLINFFIIQELSKNIDGDLRKSSFLVKEPGKPIEMYHVWDFDIAFGNADYFTSDFGVPNGAQGWYVKDFSAAGKNTGWIWRMFQDPSFVEAVKERWDELLPELKTAIPEYIDEMSLLLSHAQARNFQRWPILDKEVWPNLVCMGSYEGEVRYFKNFYLERLAWIDENLKSL